MKLLAMIIVLLGTASTYRNAQIAIVLTVA